MKIKACKICGKWFVAKGRAECCSNKCKGINQKIINKRKNDKRKDYLKRKNKEWYENNKERKKELNKKWNENNKELRKAFNNDINAEKLEKQRAYCSVYGGYFDNNEWHEDSEREKVKESKEERKEKLMSKWGALYK